MKRDPALISLSHDHHQTLYLCLRLGRASEADTSELRQAFAEHWAAHGEAHFRLEETLLFPVYAAFGDPAHPLITQALTEHVALRQLAQDVIDSPASPEQLQRLGTALAAHVRMEERELFPLIEQTIPPEPRAELGAALDAAHDGADAADAS